MPKKLLLLLTLTIILITAYITLAINSGFAKPVAKNEIETAVNQAKHLYSLEKQNAKDFSNGPCLSNALLPGWVLDLAHRPRISLDDLPQNQCSAYLEGKAMHFVELDLNGNLIRAQ